MAETRSSRLPKVRVSVWITALVAVLCTVGIVMVGSASQVISMSYYGSPWSFLSRELLWAGVGWIAFASAIWMGHEKVRRFTPLFVVVTMGMLVAVKIPGIGSSSYGSTRWIDLGPIAIQPSEAMKLALALYGASVIAKRLDGGASPRAALGPAMVVTGVAALLVLAQPDLGTSFVLVIIMLTLAFAAGTPTRLMGRWIVLITVVVLVAAAAQPYRRDRLLSFINPGAKSAEGGYQVVQSLIGMGSGGFGLGLGNSREKWGLLPNAHTDFIFSVIGEELGIVGAAIVIVLFGALAIKGWQAAERSTDRYGLLLGSALVAWISAEAVINMCAVLGMLPVTGIPLPFVSYGGTSMVITLFAAGLLVSIARSSEPGGGSKLRSLKAQSASKSKSRPKSKAEGRSKPTKATAASRRSASASARRR